MGRKHGRIVRQPGIQMYKRWHKEIKNDFILNECKNHFFEIRIEVFLQKKEDKEICPQSG